MITQSKRHNIAIKYAKQALLNSPFVGEINSVYLFGSCVKGKETYDSDVDLLVEFNDSITNNIRFSDIREIKSVVNSEDYTLPFVDLKYVIGSEWKQSDMLFYQLVKKEGVNIWN